MKDFILTQEVELLKNYLSPIKKRKSLKKKKACENFQTKININKIFNKFKKDIFLITENYGKYDGSKKFDLLNNFCLKIKEVFFLYKKDLKKLVLLENEKIKRKFENLLKNFLEKKSEEFFENIFGDFENYFDEVFKINYFDADQIFMKQNIDRLNLDLTKKMKKMDNFDFFYKLKKIDKKIQKLFFIKNNENNYYVNSDKKNFYLNFPKNSKKAKKILYEINLNESQKSFRIKNKTLNLSQIQNKIKTIKTSKIEKLSKISLTNRNPKIPKILTKLKNQNLNQIKNLKKVELPKNLTNSKTSEFIKKILTFTNHLNSETITDFIILEKNIITVSGDLSLRKTNIKKMVEKLKKEKIHTKTISKIILINAKTIATCSKDFSINFWDIENFSKTESFLYHKNWIRKIKKYQNFLFSCSDDKNFIIFNFFSKKIEKKILSPDNLPITNFTFSKNRKILVFGGKSIFFFDIKKNEITKKKNMIHGNLFLRKMKKLKNNLFITIGENGIARIWDFTSGENLQNIFLNEKIFSF